MAGIRRRSWLTGAVLALALLLTALTLQAVQAANPGITLSKTSMQIELGKSAAFTVALSEQPSQNVGIILISLMPDVAAFSTSGADAGRVTLNFTPQNWNQAQTVTLNGLSTGITGGASDIYYTTTDCSPSCSFSKAASVQVFIPTTTLKVRSGVGVEGGNVSVYLRADPPSPVAYSFKWRVKPNTVDTAKYPPTASADFSATSGTASVAANVKYPNFTIASTADTTYEGEEYFQIELYDLPAFIKLDPKAGRGKIIDDDANPNMNLATAISYKDHRFLPPGETIRLQVQVLRQNPPGAGNSFTLTLTNPRTDLFTFSQTTFTFDGDDYQNWAGQKNFTVTSKANISQGLIEVDVPVTVTYKNQSASGKPIRIYVNHGHLTKPQLSINNFAAQKVAEGQQNYTFKIRMSANPKGIYPLRHLVSYPKRAQEQNAAARVRFEDDYDANPLVFTPANWNVWRTITVSFLEDNDIDDELIIIEYNLPAVDTYGRLESFVNAMRFVVADNDETPVVNTPPTRIGKPTLSDLSSTSVSLSWRSAGEIKSYEIRYWETDIKNAERRKYVFDPARFSANDEGQYSLSIHDLKPGHSYRLRVHVRLKNGKINNKLSSGVVRFTTPAASP